MPMPQLPECDITALSPDGRGIARLSDATGSGKTLFVRGAVPGQRVVVRLTAEKSRFAEGEAVRVLAQDASLLPPACPHAGLCGGCALQALPYARQLHWKQRFVDDALHRIGRQAAARARVGAILPSPALWRYRNKMTLAFAVHQGRLVLGLRAAASHVVLPLADCPLMPEPLKTVALALARLVNERRGDFPDHFWRFAALRLPASPAPAGGARACLVSCLTAPASRRLRGRVAALGRELLAAGLGVTGFVHGERSRADTLPRAERVPTLLGDCAPRTALGGVTFALHHDSFFQVNDGAAERLCATAREFLPLAEDEPLWDLYCGVGAPGLCLARPGTILWGVEYAPGAVSMAGENAARLGIRASYTAGDVAACLPHPPAACPRPAAILVDPPRAGLGERVCRAMTRAAPARILYISCNPATLARDCALLAPLYALTRVQAVDMFPQTPHVECAALLERRA